MATYDERKQKYEAFDDKQKQQWNNMVNKSSEGSEIRQFTERYNQEMNSNQQQTSNESNFNNGNGTNGQNSTSTSSNRPSDIFVQGNNEYDPNSGYYRASKTRQGGDNTPKGNYQNTPKSDGVTSPNPDLNIDKFGETNGQVVVKEGTAAETGKPDYQADSDARMQEITNNLNAYRQNNPEYFKDRNTFNTMFHYNDRDDSQKALLDTYWKKKEDIDKANLYTTGDSLANGMKDAEITPDQLNYIKEFNNDAYREWQQKQLDDINLRIANLATPADPTDNAELFNNLLDKLNLEPGDPYQIYDNWYSMCERLGVFSDSDKLAKYQNQLDENHSKMESIMSRYASSIGGTVSDALAAARMQKALAPYQQKEVDLQNSYTTLLNGRNSNLAIANQSATALAMQAQEDQRVWNQRLQGLGFAMTTASYRTPEQQAQLQLQTQQIQNDMSLLQQSLQNDLGLYNQYQAAKLQRQLENELTDLSVQDETQLKANLNNLLSDYYKNYGDIIQRSQAQAVEDIMAYAKKKGITVAQALTENFIKPLQNKAEYKQKVASDYGMLSKQSIATINGRSVIMTTNPNGSISYQYIDDPYETGVTDRYTIGDTEYVVYNGKQMTAEEFNKKYGGKVRAGTAKDYDVVDVKTMTAAPINYGFNTLGTFLLEHNEGDTGGQCGKFVNDYLEWIGLGTQGDRYYDNDLSTKLSSVNSDEAIEGSIAVFDYGHLSKDGINHGHVGIVTKVYKDGSFDVIDSNYDTKNPETITKRHINAGSPSCKGFFDPSKPPRATSTTESSVGGLTTSQLDSLAKDYIDGVRSYSDIKATYGDDVLNAVGLTASILKESGYEKSKIITDPAKILSTEQSLMSKFNTMNDGNRTALAQATKMQQALDKIDPKLGGSKLYNNASTQVIITAFNKLLDENSVVRESEYARTPEGLSYLDRMQGKLDKFVNGGAGMTFESLKSMVDLANEFTAQYQKNQDQLAQLIRNQAQTFGLNEANILPIDVIQQLDNPTARTTTTGPTDDTQKYFDGLQSTVPMNTGNVTANYMYSKIDFILNGNKRC